MRDLASRLRAIVRQPVPGRTPAGLDRPADTPPSFGGGTRELTYELDLGVSGLDLDRTAARLGGARYDAGASACVVIDRVWEPEHWHGRGRVSSFAIESASPISLFDGRLAAVADWASRPVFFDIETTGLSGGAGTLPLLAGCGWFEDGAFRVRQFFLNGPAGEHALLDGLAEIFGSASLLVTYNGRTFDVPVMETRWAYHRRENATDTLPHFDMLPAARRLWGRVSSNPRSRSFSLDEPRESQGCTLSALERSVLRFHRLDDVPGLEIPSRYFQFLRTGDPSVIEGVLEHNRHDLVSLAALMAHALRLASEGPEACETAGEQLGLARLYDRAGDEARAEQAFGLAAASDDPEVASHALARLATLLRSQFRFHESAQAWQGVLALSAGFSSSSPLERRATEALAIHHEHRARDFDEARRYAETLRRDALGQRVADVDRRLVRLEKKIKKRQETDGRLLR